MHLKEKHDTDVLIRKKDVLESGTEYEITFVNAEQRSKQSDEASTQSYESVLQQPVVDQTTTNQQLLNELIVNDIETLVKNNPFVLSDQELRTCQSEEGRHHQHFDELKLMDFPVM